MENDCDKTIAQYCEIAVRCSTLFNEVNQSPAGYQSIDECVSTLREKCQKNKEKSKDILLLLKNTVEHGDKMNSVSSCLQYMSSAPSLK